VVWLRVVDCEGVPQGGGPEEKKESNRPGPAGAGLDCHSEKEGIP